MEEVSRLDIYDLIFNGVEESNVTLEDGDMVLIPAGKKPEEEEVVFIYGHVQKPGEVKYKVGNRLSDYLRLAGGPLKEANLKSVKITGMREGKFKTLTVNMHHVLFGGKFNKDPEVYVNDIIYLPERFFYMANMKDAISLVLTALSIYTLFIR